MQRPLFEPECSWRPPRLSDLPQWDRYKRVAIDTETCDPSLKKLGPGVRRGGYVAGVSFAFEDGPAFYLPLRHSGDNVEDPQQAVRYLKDNAAAFKGDVCGANLSYDLDYLAELGITFPCARFFRDCQIAEGLVDELQDRYSLADIAERHGMPGKDTALLEEAAYLWHVNPRSEMYKLPGRFVADYAMQDAVLPLALLRRQERAIDEQDLWSVYDLESRVLPITVAMRRRGIAVDFDRLAAVQSWAKQGEAEQLQAVYKATGVRIAVDDVWKAGLLAKALEAHGIEVPRTPATKKPSVTQGWLLGLKHPTARHLIRARKLNKLRTTFANSIHNHQTKGRIHCSFNQLRRTVRGTDDESGARYGRMSSSNPNMQQQPSRDDFGKQWRSIFVPDAPLWASCDYKAQEPRMLIHFAEATNCSGAQRAGDAYRKDPNTDNHTMMARLIFGYGEDEEPDKKHRTQAKTIYLGLGYGMGGAKLAHSLQLPTAWKKIKDRNTGKEIMIEIAGSEAQSILDQFNRQAPFVKQLAAKATQRANRVGFVTTIGGRRCRFPTGPKGVEWTHKALNRLLQGSGADQMKQAMVDAEAAGHELQLQVHDELNESVQDVKQAHELAEIMENAIQLSVPSHVDVTIGPSWGEAK